MAVLIGVIYLAMVLTHTTTIGGTDSLVQLFSSTRGMILIALLVVLALLNPRLGYVTRYSDLELPAQREALMKAMSASRYSLVREEGGTMIFRPDNRIKRIAQLGDDALVVRFDNGRTSVSGVRRDVVNAVFRMETYSDK